MQTTFKNGKDDKVQTFDTLDELIVEMKKALADHNVKHVLIRMLPDTGKFNLKKEPKSIMDSLRDIDEAFKDG